MSSSLFAPAVRIAVVGPLVGGSHSVAVCASRALQRLGHEVRFVDNSRHMPVLEAIKAAPDPEPLRRGMEAQFLEMVRKTSRDAVSAFRPQLALYLAQAPVLAVEDLAELREAGVPTVLWFVEDGGLFTHWRAVVGRYDHFWTIQPGAFVDEVAQAGQRFVDYVPLACDPAIHHPYPVAETSGYSSDVSFVGSGYPNRVAFFAALGALPGLRLYGTHLAREPQLRPSVAHDGVLPHDTLARIFAGTRVNLNLSSSATAEAAADKDFVNPRAFEICGCGGFQLVDARIPVGWFFDVGREVITFGSVEEARDKIAYYLAHESERAAVAARGRARALAEHTYDHRLAAALGRLMERDGDRVASAWR